MKTSEVIVCLHFCLFLYLWASIYIRLVAYFKNILVNMLLQCLNEYNAEKYVVKPLKLLRVMIPVAKRYS